MDQYSYIEVTTAAYVSWLLFPSGGREPYDAQGAQVWGMSPGRMAAGVTAGISGPLHYRGLRPPQRAARRGTSIAGDFADGADHGTAAGPFCRRGGTPPRQEVGLPCSCSSDGCFPRLRLGEREEPTSRACGLDAASISFHSHDRGSRCW